MISIQTCLFVAIATCIALLAYNLSQHRVDLELPFSDLPLQGSEADKVIRLPDQPKVDFQQFAGYITVDEVNQRNLFYYFVEAEVDAASKPIVLWLSGGPGCSSIGQGAFSEHGPFLPTRKGGLVKNRYSWNRVANMLYLESPVGVGFSYSANTSDYFMVTDERTARDALVFLQGWFTKFQQYGNSDVFITGVSYAGHWAPQIAELILQNKPSFNLKGIAMGNPLLEFTTDYNSRAEFFWTHGMISVETYGMLRTVCNYAQILRENINGTLSTDCERVFYQFSKEIGRYVDTFNMMEDSCLPSEFELDNETPMDDGEKCVEREVPSYMNRGEVREAIHAKLMGITKWTICSNVLLYNRKNFEDPIISLLGRLVKSGVRVMVYSGDQDPYLPLTGTHSLVQGLAKDIGLDSDSHRSWFDGRQVAGWTQTYGDNLTFATIKGAGHSAAASQPRRGDGLEPVRLADEAMSFVREFNEANPSNRGRVSPPVITTLPSVPAPSFSVFVDAGCNSNGPTVWGIVFKNHDMITTFSASKYDDIAVDPVMAEALGVRWAIQLVREEGLHSVSIYSDAANVVDCIYNKVKIAAIEMVAQDCRDLLSSLPNVNVLLE